MGKTGFENGELHSKQNVSNAHLATLINIENKNAVDEFPILDDPVLIMQTGENKIVEIKKFAGKFGSLTWDNDGVVTSGVA
jgi:hypothetical protein